MSGNARDRRRLRRLSGEQATNFAAQPVAPQAPTVQMLHPEGAERRLLVADYGASYVRTKGTVVGYDGDMIQFKVAKRKSPMVVNPEHLAEVA